MTNTIAVLALIFALAAMFVAIYLFIHRQLQQKAEAQATSSTEEKKPDPAPQQDSKKEENHTTTTPSVYVPGSPLIGQINHLLAREYKAEGYECAIRLNAAAYKWTRMEEMVGRVLLLVIEAINQYEYLWNSTEDAANSRKNEGYLSLYEELMRKVDYYRKEYERLYNLKEHGEEVIQKIRDHTIDMQTMRENKENDFNPFFVMLLSFENGFQEGIIDVTRVEPI